MTERQFAPGEVIYREGDRSDFAYFIKSGRVEILKAEADGPRQVTVLGAGDVFGEMGVVLDQRRSVTARAMEAVTVRAVSRSSFLQAVNQQPDMARSMLKTLLSRLHEEEDRPSARIMALPKQTRNRPGKEPAADKRAEAPRDDPADPRPKPAGDSAMESPVAAKLRLRAGNEHLARQVPSGGVAVTHLPFRVGRKPAKGENVPTEGNDLEIEDSRPFNLSRRHFSIEQTGRGLLVRDCGSHLGTKVNGVRIGHEGRVNIAILRSGENEIIAGSEGSPYRFLLQVLLD
jgi:pSer/pThr/pTyr-binding forkhead associated (FHA) protein